MTTKKPYIQALEEAVADGPISRDELMRRVIAAVPTGQAIEVARRRRRQQRRFTGYGDGLAEDQVAKGYENRHKSDLYAGARQLAYWALRRRLRSGTLFVNADGLIQHRDWKP